MPVRAIAQYRLRGNQLLSGLLFRAARNDLVDPVVRFTFTHLSAYLPIRRVVDTDEVVGFFHPRPSWSTHVLIVPKVGIPSLLDATSATAPYFREVLRQARIVCERVCDGPGARSLIVNGGRYQDVGQLHAHVVCGDDVAPYPSVNEPVPPGQALVVSAHPNPLRPVHHVVRLKVSENADRTSYLPSDTQVGQLLDEVRALVARFGLERRGFSLIASSAGHGCDYSCFHIMSE